MSKNVKNWTQDVVVGVFSIVVGVFSFPVGVGGRGRGFLDTPLFTSMVSKHVTQATKTCTFALTKLTDNNLTMNLYTRK